MEICEEWGCINYTACHYLLQRNKTQPDFVFNMSTWCLVRLWHVDLNTWSRRCVHTLKWRQPIGCVHCYFCSSIGSVQISGQLPHPVGEGLFTMCWYQSSYRVTCSDKHISSSQIFQTCKITSQRPSVGLCDSLDALVLFQLTQT